MDALADVVDVGKGSWAFTLGGGLVEDIGLVASDAGFGFIVPTVARSGAVGTVSRG